MRAGIQRWLLRGAIIMRTRLGKQGNDTANTNQVDRRNGRVTWLGLLAMGLLAGASGCGELSFMEVSVVVASNTAVRSDCLFAINSCEVKVTGSENTNFTLGNNACVHPLNFTIGKFQFGTDSDSGNIAFHVDIFDGNLVKLGQGDGSDSIKAGGRKPVTVNVTPDAAAFAPSCPP